MSWSRCSERVAVHLQARPGHAVLPPTIRHRFSALSLAWLPVASCSLRPRISAQESSGKPRPPCLGTNRQHKHISCLGSRWSSLIHHPLVTERSVRDVRIQAQSCSHGREYSTQAKDRAIKPFTFIDPFAGIGCCNLAATSLGGICVYANEIDRYAIMTYETNHCRGGPGVSNVDGRDIRTVTLTMSHPSCMLPEADMLFAGIPCQDYSRNGKGKGLDGESGDLIYEVMKLLIHLRIPIALLENVSPFALDKKKRSMEVVEQEFKAAGYYMSWHIYSAVDFNLPQNRDRCFIVAVREDLATGPFESGSQRLILANIVKNPPSRRRYPALTDFLDPPKAIEDLSQYTLSRNGVWVPKRIINGKKGEIEWVDEIKTSPAGLKRVGQWNSNFKSGMLVYHHSGLASCLTTTPGDWYQVPGPDGTDVIRRLSFPEKLKVQGIPKGFKLPVSPKQAHKQIGNSVPPPMVKWIIRCAQDQFSHAFTSGTRSSVEVWPRVQARNQSPEEKESISRQLKNLSQRKIRGIKRRKYREESEALDTSSLEGVETRHQTGPGKSVATCIKRLDELDKQVKALQKDISSLKLEYKLLAEA